MEAEFEYEYFRAGDVCEIDFSRLYPSSVDGWIKAEIRAVSDDSVALKLILGRRPLIVFLTQEGFNYLLHWANERPERVSPRPQGTYY